MMMPPRFKGMAVMFKPSPGPCSGSRTRGGMASRKRRSVEVVRGQGGVEEKKGRKKIDLGTEEILTSAQREKEGG